MTSLRLWRVFLPDVAANSRRGCDCGCDCGCELSQFANKGDPVSSKAHPSWPTTHAGRYAPSILAATTCSIHALPCLALSCLALPCHIHVHQPRQTTPHRTAQQGSTAQPPEEGKRGRPDPGTQRNTADLGIISSHRIEPPPPRLPLHPQKTPIIGELTHCGKLYMSINETLKKKPHTQSSIHPSIYLASFLPPCLLQGRHPIPSHPIQCYCSRHKVIERKEKNEDMNQKRKQKRENKLTRRSKTIPQLLAP